MSYFVRTAPHAYRATDHTSGAWEITEQHIAPSLGLLTHVVECDRDTRRGDDLALGRLSFDILGTVPVGDVEVAVDVVRPGRTIELVEARMSHAGRDVVRLRAWLLQPHDTADHAASRLPAIPGPDDTPPWDPTSLWQGGFIAGIEVRRQLVEPGRGHVWARTDIPIVDDAPVSTLATAVGLFDIANGMTVLAEPRTVAFPNVDLSAHLFREPTVGWMGFDSAVSFGPRGLGLTETTLHDTSGPFATSSQSLTVRPS